MKMKLLLSLGVLGALVAPAALQAVTKPFTTSGTLTNNTPFNITVNISSSPACTPASIPVSPNGTSTYTCVGNTHLQENPLTPLNANFGVTVTNNTGTFTGTFNANLGSNGNVLTSPGNFNLKFLTSGPNVQVQIGSSTSLSHVIKVCPDSTYQISSSGCVCNSGLVQSLFSSTCVSSTVENQQASALNNVLVLANAYQAHPTYANLQAANTAIVNLNKQISSGAPSATQSSLNSAPVLAIVTAMSQTSGSNKLEGQACDTSARCANGLLCVTFDGQTAYNNNTYAQGSYCSTISAVKGCPGVQTQMHDGGTCVSTTKGLGVFSTKYNSNWCIGSCSSSPGLRQGECEFEGESCSSTLIPDPSQYKSSGSTTSDYPKGSPNGVSGTSTSPTITLTVPVMM